MPRSLILPRPRTMSVLALSLALIASACSDDDAATTAASAATISSTVPTTTTTTTTMAASTTTGPFIPPPPVTTTPEIDVDVAVGGEAIIGMLDEPSTLNPLAPGGTGSTWDRISQLYLVGISDVTADLELVPELLVELPTTDNGGLTVEDDGTMTVVMEIRPEARWADGVPVSGDDFFFTYQTMLDVDGLVLAPGSDPDLYDQIIPDSFIVAPKSISFRMERPTLQHELLFPIVLPRHQMTGTDVLVDWAADAPWLSGGPFVFDSWVPGEQMTFVRNPSYWKIDDQGLVLPYLERITFRFYDSAAALVDAFRIREVDVITPPPVIQVLDALIPLVTEGAGVFVIPGVLWEHLAFSFGHANRNDESLNEHADFRRAIAYAVDVEALVTSLYAGYNDPIDSYLEAYAPAMSSGAWSQYEHDVIEARRLIDRACGLVGRNCNEEPPVVVFTTTANDDLRVRTAALMEPMLADVGVRVRFELEPSALFFGETLVTGSWDLGMWAYPGYPGAPAVARAHDFLDPLGPPPFGSNYARWGTEAVAEQEPMVLADGTTIDVNEPASSLINAASDRFAELRRAMDSAVDAGDLQDLVREAEELVADQAIIIPLWARLWIGAAWLDEVAGYEPNPSAVGDTWNVERWFRVDLPAIAGGDGNQG